MTFLPPPPPAKRHACPLPNRGQPSDRAHHKLGTLWECPTCGRWWHYRVEPQDAASSWGERYEWAPVRWYHIRYRKRIAAHETERMHYRCPTAVGRFHWWDVPL